MSKFNVSNQMKTLNFIPHFRTSGWDVIHQLVLVIVRIPTAASQPSRVVYATSPGFGKTVTSPLVVPAVGNRDAMTPTPEVTVITATPFNRVVCGSMSESSLVNQAAPATQVTSDEIEATDDPQPPGHSQVSAPNTSGTASYLANVASGPMTSAKLPPSRAFRSERLDIWTRAYRTCFWRRSTRVRLDHWERSPDRLRHRPAQRLSVRMD